MYHKHLLIATMAILCIGAGPAWAEMDGTANEQTPIVDGRYSQYGGPRRQDQQVDRRDQGRRGDPRGQQGRADPRHPDPHGQARAYQGRDYDRGAYYQPGQGDHRGAGPDHRFRAGDRLPRYYRGNGYVVDDWRRHRLGAPPYGYQWVQTGSDYVLIAIATGIIVQILLAN